MSVWPAVTDASVPVSSCEKRHTGLTWLSPSFGRGSPQPARGAAHGYGPQLPSRCCVRVHATALARAVHLELTPGTILDLVAFPAASEEVPVGAGPHLLLVSRAKGRQSPGREARPPPRRGRPSPPGRSRGASFRLDSNSTAIPGKISAGPWADGGPMSRTWSGGGSSTSPALHPPRVDSRQGGARKRSWRGTPDGSGRWTRAPATARGSWRRWISGHDGQPVHDSLSRVRALGTDAALVQKEVDEGHSRGERGLRDGREGSEVI